MQSKRKALERDLRVRNDSIDDRCDRAVRTGPPHLVEFDVYI